MAWDDTDITALRGVLDRVVAALGALDGKDVLVLGSATGEVAFLLAPLTGSGTVVGLEAHGPSLAPARERVSAMGLAPRVRFGLAAGRRITFPYGSFDAVVSDTVVHASPEPTDVPPSEMVSPL